MLALIADYLATTCITVKTTATFVEDATNLNISAFSIAFGAECVRAVVAMQCRVLVHSLRPVEVVVVVDLVFLYRVFDEVLRQVFERAVETGAPVHVVSAANMSRRLVARFRESTCCIYHVLF